MTDDERAKIQSQIQHQLELQKQGVLDVLSQTEPQNVTPSPFSTEKGKVYKSEEEHFTSEKHKIYGKNQMQHLVDDSMTAAAIGELKDEEFQTEIKDKARKGMRNEINRVGNQLIKEEQDSAYDANKEACEDFGMEGGRPTWQIKMMKIGSGIWFAIYYIIAMLTITPISVFSRGLRHFFKRDWIVIALAVFIWLIVILSPLIGYGINKLISIAN